VTTHDPYQVRTVPFAGLRADLAQAERDHQAAITVGRRELQQLLAEYDDLRKRVDA
jgi:hypothetical protein